MKSHIIFVKCIKWWFFHHFLNFNVDTVVDRRKYAHSEMAATTGKKRGYFSRKIGNWIWSSSIRKKRTKPYLVHFCNCCSYGEKKVRLKYIMSNTFSSHCIKVVPFSLESILQSTNVKGMFKNPPFLPDSHIHGK